MPADMVSPALFRHAFALALAFVAAGPGPASAAQPPAIAEDLAQLVSRVEATERSDPEAARRLSDAALARLAQQPDADLEMRTRLSRCDYFNERDRAAATRELEQMRTLLPRLRRPGLRAGLLGCEGEMQENAGDNVQAMALYEQAVTVAETAGDDERLANALYLRGYLRGVLGDVAAGLADLQRALGLYERLKMPAHAQTAINGVAILYNRMGDFEQARRYYEDTLKAQTEAGMARERVVTLHNLGRVHERLQHWDDAQRAFEATLALARELAYARGQVYALRGLASVRNAQDDPKRALQLLDEGQRLFGNAPDERLRAQLQLQRGVALRQLGRPAEALAVLRDALEVFRQGDASHEEAIVRDETARVLAEQGDWRQAFEQQQAARKLTEGMLRRQVDQRFATLKVQFDTELRDKENALLQRENKAGELALAEQQRASRLQVIAALLASALAAVLAMLVWRQRRAGQQLRDLALTDELTGLPNRRHMLRELQRLLERSPPAAALLIVDLDHFKPINDQFGHLIGDEILRALADAWRSLTGHGMRLGRLGGEEFVAVVDGADIAQAAALGERLRAAAQGLDVSRWLTERRVTVSVGATVLRPGDTLGSALSRADEALYRAKAGGRDRVDVA
jgi:diguanylate cyclase (GGDEF)-like protein